MAKLVIVVLISVALYGCDLASNLIVKNRSGAPAHLRLVEDRNGKMNEYILTLEAQGPGTRTYVGFGWWSCFRGQMLEQNVAKFRRIDIVSQRDSVSFSGAALRTRFITGRRPGLFGCTCVWKVH